MYRYRKTYIHMRLLCLENFHYHVTITTTIWGNSGRMSQLPHLVGVMKAMYGFHFFPVKQVLLFFVYFQIKI